ncbi:MAG: outer membrane beta-barrel protein [Gemmatimonadota bacterium]
MIRRCATLVVVTLASIGLPRLLHAQSPDTAAVAATATTAAFPVKLSGYVTASYTYSTNDNGGTIAGRLYDTRHDQFMFNAAKIVLAKPVETSSLSAGFQVDALLGTNGTAFQASGLGLGTLGDVTQALVTLNVPTGKDRYIQFKAGKSPTLMGLEVIEDVANPNLSIGNQFIFVENTTNTGVGSDLKFGPTVDAEVRVINGWDLLTDNNTKKSFMGRLGFTPDAKTGFSVLGYVGPEQPLAIDPSGSNQRYGGEALLSRKLAGSVALTAQFDAGKEQHAAPSGNDASWWAGGVWLTSDITPKIGVALRGDYVDDKQGARSIGFFTGTAPAADLAHKFGSGTVTLNIRSWENALVRPEIRYDRSNLPVFGGKKDQVSFGLGVSYIY